MNSSEYNPIKSLAVYPENKEWCSIGYWTSQKQTYSEGQFIVLAHLPIDSEFKEEVLLAIRNKILLFQLPLKTAKEYERGVIEDMMDEQDRELNKKVDEDDLYGDDNEDDFYTTEEDITDHQDH